MKRLAVRPVRGARGRLVLGLDMGCGRDRAAAVVVARALVNGKPAWSVVRFGVGQAAAARVTRWWAARGRGGAVPRGAAALARRAAASAAGSRHSLARAVRLARAPAWAAA